MKYSVKWVEDNLGVTRKALRNYEAKGLMQKDSSRNPTNNYREYDEEDIDRIWRIKLLQGIGYTVKEILEFSENPESDFYTSISNKVTELEKKRDEAIQYVEFAKSIKLLGRVPTTKQVGSIRFDDFIKYERENWNFYSDPESAQVLSLTETILNKQPKDWAVKDLDELEETLKSLGDLEKAYYVSVHYKLLSELRAMDYTSVTIQTIVKMLYEYLCEHKTEPELDGKITPQFFATYTASFFLDGDVAVLQRRNYGEEGCLFLANAIAYFGGYANYNEIE